MSTLSALEELMTAGFIQQDEYQQRKEELMSQPFALSCALPSSL